MGSKAPQPAPNREQGHAQAGRNDPQNVGPQDDRGMQGQPAGPKPQPPPPPPPKKST